MKLIAFVQQLSRHKFAIQGDASLSFAVGAACCLLGAIGLGVNYFQPGTTTFSAFLIIGCFYLLAATASTISSRRKNDDSVNLANKELATEPPIVVPDRAA